MKKFSKLIATLLIFIMALSLCACGGSEKEEEKKDDTKVEDTDKTEKDDSEDEADKEETDKTENVEEAEIGTVLDAPEKVFDLEKFYIYFTYPDEEAETGMATMEIALDDSDDFGVLYVTTGPLKLDEIIYEADAEGITAKYYKDVFAEGFTKEESLSAEELQTEVTGILELLDMMGYEFSETYPDTQFKKCESQTAPLTGEAYVYELIEDGESHGTVWVDQETGVFVKLFDENGEELFTVQDISTTELGIPEYK